MKRGRSLLIDPETEIPETKIQEQLANYKDFIKQDDLAKKETTELAELEPK